MTSFSEEPGLIDPEDISSFLTGDVLYGDDFDPEEIANWFADEQEGYAGLGARDVDNYKYSYHQLNITHAFRYLDGRAFESALGIGSAYGDEFLPIVGNIERLTILEASDALSIKHVVGGVPCLYEKPTESGDIPFAEKSFDLISALGVFHHIPNVSHVIGECARVLSDRGVFILREPVVSMGDWRYPRSGLTKRERGIPIKLLRKILSDNGLKIQHEALCAFPPLSRLCKGLGIDPYNSKVCTSIDALLSKMFRWNLRYHASSSWQKIRPTAAFFVLVKDDDT